jgi:hypothetical protein
MFLVQFKRFRRGVLEVTRTLHLPSIDGAAALAHARSLAGTRHWPAGTDALRVMDDNGRTLLDWRVPAATLSPSRPSKADALNEHSPPAGAHSGSCTHFDNLAGSRAIALSEPEGAYRAAL